MSDLTIYPAQLTEMSVAQLEALPPDQLAEVQHNLEQLQDWTKQARAKLDAALVRRFGELERAARADSGKDFGTVHFNDGPLRVTADQPKRVSWDQPQLAAGAGRNADLHRSPDHRHDALPREVSETGRAELRRLRV